MLSPKDFIDLGTAGIVIAVVIVFLRYIEKRDKDWRLFFQAVLLKKDVPLENLSAAVQKLITEFREHDAMERAKLDEMSKTIHARN